VFDRLQLKMFNLGFTMEELMFPENCQTKFFVNKKNIHLTDRIASFYL